MTPVLYPKGETNFITDGLGRLTETVSCLVTEELNGVYECSLKIPRNARLASALMNYEQTIIYTTHANGKAPQPFDVYRVDMTEEGIITVNAKHISRRLNRRIIKPYSYTYTGPRPGAYFYGYFNNYYNEYYQLGMRFAINVPDVLYHTATVVFESEKPRTAMDYLLADKNSVLTYSQTIIDAYEDSEVINSWVGEYEWDKWDVNLLARRGSTTPVIARYGSNVQSFKRYFDYNNAYNGVVPYYSGQNVIIGDASRRKDFYPDLYSDDIDMFTAVDVSSELQDTETVTKNDVTDKGANIVWEIATKARGYDGEDSIEIELLENAEDIHGDIRYAELGDNAVFYNDDLTYDNARVTRVVYDSLLERNQSVRISQNTAPEKTYGDIIRASI